MPQPYLGRAIAEAFHPPFRGLGAVVWVYFVLCFIFSPSSLILQGSFTDPDDYLKMVQAIDWLKGQNWFDSTQYRMNPPQGTFIHFSNFFNLLYGIPIFLLKPLLGYTDAATVTAALFPLLYFALFLAAVRWTAISIVDKKWIGLTAYITLFSSYVMYQFSPGRADHHGVTALLAVLSIGAASRMILYPSILKWGVLAGGVLAFGLYIGLEFLPVFFVISTWLGVISILKGGGNARAGFVFSVALLVFSLVFLFISRGPAHFFAPYQAAYSFIYVAVASGAVIWFACVNGTAHQRLAVRTCTGGVAACVLMAAFFTCFPEMKLDPHGTLPQELRVMILNYAGEARPLMLGKSDLSVLAFPLLAIVTCVDVLLRKDKMHAGIVGLFLTAILVTTLLAIFYQMRLILYAQALSIGPMALFVQEMWILADRYKRRQSARIIKVVTVLVAGPLLTVLIPALMRDLPLRSGILFFPAAYTGTDCPQGILDNYLNAAYGRQPLLIMNTLGEGGEILFRTPHKVLAAPYHMNYQGNMDSFRFFSTYDPENARAIAANRNVDLVVMCRTTKYVGDELKPTAHALNFSQQLLNGQVPAWLKPVAVPGNVMLFEVRRPLKIISDGQPSA